MTKAGLSLTQLGDGLPWLSLYSFLRNLSGESAYLRERFGEAAAWQTAAPLPAMVADLYDAVNLLRVENAKMHGNDWHTFPPYPRPGSRSEEKRPQMSKEDFYEWMKGVANV